MGMELRKVLVGVALLVMAIPALGEAAVMHNFSCSDCHRASIAATGMSDVCLKCHDYNTRHDVLFSDGQPHRPQGGYFTRATQESTVAGTQGISHNFTGSDTNPAAGANPPSDYVFFGAWRSSAGKVVCSRCHDQHGDVSNTTLVKAVSGTPTIPSPNDELCYQCHSAWYQNLPDAQLSHPVNIDYATATALANDPDHKLNDTISGNQVQLVNGKIYCTTCHSLHYTDSDASTVDGSNSLYNTATLGVGDANLLRGDGPKRTGANRDTVGTGTAQLRSNICQSCHTYKLHGKGGNQQLIGCLDCHGGHGYNGGAINAFIIADRSPDAVPVRALRAPAGNAPVDFPNFPVGGSVRTKWSDDVKGQANGFCEKCHGDVQDDVPANGIGRIAPEHLQGDITQCTSCHIHGDTVYSFANDANAATCGQCHGFPPYKNISGYRASIGDANDGGYADNKVDVPNYSYSGSGYLKDETKTAHKTHAGAKLATNPGQWYFVGKTGIDNCKVCHGPSSGTPAGGHRVNAADTFRNVPFGTIATANGNLVPSYNTSTFVCTNVYCHTNGTPRTGDNGVTVSRSYTGVHTTPFWVGNGTNYSIGGYGSIFAQTGTTRCNDCHGYNAATMATQNNSARHQAHLGAGSMARTFGCEVCHVGTAASSTALAADSTDGQKWATGGGKHVNGEFNIDYKTSGSVLYNSLSINTTGAAGLNDPNRNYNPITGTCSVYCHDPDDTGKTADWDTAGALACDACHGGKATDTVKISSGSHSRHVTDPTGPMLACDKCHGTNSNTGAHTTHVNGADDYVLSVCNTCHAYDVGETVLVWGNASTSECRTCHTGATTTAAAAIWATSDMAPPKTNALSSGHGKTTGTYNVSGLSAANQDCEACHDKTAAGHFDSDNLDKRLIGGFDCSTCHDGTPAVAVKTHSNTDPSYTGQKRADFTKTCLACHDPHGTSNITMIGTTKTDFAGTVVFSSFGNASPVNNDNSFDELETVAANVNNDDICATCHTTVLHNNRAVGGTHNEGKTCTTCHNHNSGLGGFMPSGGTACNDCHGNPPSAGDVRHTAAKIGAHELHAQSTTHDKDAQGHDATDCDACHPGASTYTYVAGGSHQNGSVQLAAGMAGGTTGCTSACHASTAGDGYWTDTTKAGLTGNGLACTACHYYAASPVSGNTLSDTHDEHFAKGKTCSACHTMTGDYNSGTGHVGPLTHINDFVDTTTADDDGALYTDKAVATVDEAGFDEGAGVRDVIRSGMTYTDANTCSGGIGLGCHATGTPDWDVVIPNDTTGCVQCHTNSTDATVNPNSGLHFNGQNPTVSGVEHDATLSGGCVICHTTLSAQATHMNNTLNADGSVAGDRTAMGLFATYTTSGVNNVGTCAGAGVSGASCHPGGDAGTWARKWDSSIHYVATGNECKGCHGGFGETDWTFGSVSNTTDGSVEHNRDWDGDATSGEVIGEHKDNVGNTTRCNICHVYNDAGYTFGTNHRNGNIEMNSSMSYSTTNRNCTSTCHANNTNHNLEASGWTVAAVSGPALSCYTCHGNGSSQYWPGGATFPNRAGEHQAHITALAARIGITLPGTDAEQKRMCAYCHNDATGVGGAGHDASAVQPADVGGINPIWDLTNPPTVTDTGSSVVSGSCSSIDCHNNIATTPTYDWYAGAASACAMCHTSGAADTTHTAHTAAGMGMTITCTSCHGTGTTTTTPPSTGHISGTLEVAGSVAFTYSGGMTGTCGTNACHYNGRYVTAARQAPKTSPYNWGTPIAGCDACHETTNVLSSGSHTAHMTTTSQAMTCNSCHPAGTVATHIDAAVNFTGAAATYNTSTPEPTTDETFSTCGTNTCHNSGRTVAAVLQAPYNNGLGSYTWNTAIGAVNSCTECHNNSALGELHSNHTGAATLFGINSVTCNSCHGANATAGTHTGHVEGTIALVAGLAYSGTPDSVNVTLSTFGTCNTTTCHSNGLGSAVLTPAWNDASSAGDDCTLCHGNAGANLNSKAHPIHIATAAQSGKAWGPYPTAGSSNCGECHASPANNSSMATYTTHIDGAINFVGGTLAATSACNTCHGGATPAATAKSNWTTTPTRVTCESCHGDYTAASINAKTAPSNAGVSYDSYGHGKVAPASTGELCLDCHDNTAAGHIDGTTGDDKRLQVVNGQNYGTVPNAFCASACHATTMNVHYANGNTVGGTSDDAIYCYTCHNPHGQNGNQDAMIRNLIAGRTVSGFTSKGTRSSYESASFNSVCQVCHDGTEVTHFNRATNETTHQGGVDVCTSCHDHTAATAFSASGGGCDGCHGYPPVQRLTGAAASYTYAKLEDYPGGGRAHAVVGHLNPTGLDPADGWAPCAPCHTETDHNMGLGVSNLLVQRDISGNWANEATRYPRVNLAATTDKGGTAFYNMSTRNTSAGMGTCANTTCHFSESPKWDCLPADTTNDPN